MDDHGGRSPMLAEMRARGWELKDVYRELGGEADLPGETRALFWPLFNGQAREIMGPRLEWSAFPFTERGTELESFGAQVRERLDEIYVVGVSERFSQSVRLFADSFGWRKVFVPRVNVRPYPSRRSEIDEETRALIRAYNRVDAELHARHLALVEGLPPARRVDDLRWRADQRRRHEVWRARRRVRRALGKLPVGRRV